MHIHISNMYLNYCANVCILCILVRVVVHLYAIQLTFSKSYDHELKNTQSTLYDDMSRNITAAVSPQQQQFREVMPISLFLKSLFTWFRVQSD